jgi:hypothetical protein
MKDTTVLISKGDTVLIDHIGNLIISIS